MVFSSKLIRIGVVFCRGLWKSSSIGADVQMKQYRLFSLYFAVIAFLLCFAGSCSYLQKSNVPPEEALKKRVDAHWEALIRDVPEAAFAFVEPKGRKMPNRMRFCSGMGKFIFLDYEIEEIKLFDDRADVRVKRTFKIRPGVIPVELKDPVSQTLTDAWIRIDGIWYIAFEKPRLLFPESRKGTNTAPSRRQPLGK